MNHPEVLTVDPTAPEPDRIARAASVLRRGGLVAFPTETVYGLGADGLNPEAVARIFLVKGRPATKGLILHLAPGLQLETLVEEVPPAAERLIAAFTPGPLTLVLPARSIVPPEVRGGGETVAVRWPDHPVARALIQATDGPVAAPSANPSGEPPPTEAAEVTRTLGPGIDLVLDGGPTPLRIASTVVDLTRDPPAILREGAVPAGRVWEVLGGEPGADA